MKRILASLLVVFGCRSAALEFDASVSPEERRIINKDLENLCRLNYDLDDEDINYFFGIFGIETLSCDRLKRWLGERIGIITRHLSDLPYSVDHWRPRFFPEAIDYYFTGAYRKLLEREAQGGSSLGAFNLGTLVTEIRSTLSLSEYPAYFMRISDNAERSLVPLRTRQSIIYLMDRFFHPQLGSADTSSIADSMLRLSLLFHEARHSDGFNEEQSRFDHILCADGRRVCDDFFDEANGIHFTFLYFASLACDGCTDYERYVLNAEAENRFHLIEPTTRQPK